MGKSGPKNLGNWKVFIFWTYEIEDDNVLANESHAHLTKKTIELECYVRAMGASY